MMPENIRFKFGVSEEFTNKIIKINLVYKKGFQLGLLKVDIMSWRRIIIIAMKSRIYCLHWEVFQFCRQNIIIEI